MYFSSYYLFPINSSVRLEVPMRVEYKGHELERTFAIDTIVYILNRLFRMHQDELDVACKYHFY